MQYYIGCSGWSYSAWKGPFYPPNLESSDYIEDFILEMKDRDHVALPFDNEYQFKEIVNAFIRRGINCYQINVLLIYKKQEQKFVESLDKIPNVNSLFISGEITIIPAEESTHYDSSWF